MLVLTRKKGQKLIINDNIEVTILETRGDTVKIGVNAPKNVTIFREEIYEEIKKANKQAIKDISVNEVASISNLTAVKKDFASDYLNKLQTIAAPINKPENK
jgi:carbon storage regulator